MNNIEIIDKINGILKGNYNHKDMYTCSNTKELLNEIKLLLEINEIGKDTPIKKNIMQAFKRSIKLNDIRKIFCQIYTNNYNAYTHLNGYYLLEWSDKDNIPKQLHPYIDCLEIDKENAMRENLTFENLARPITSANEEDKIHFSLKLDDLRKMSRTNKVLKTQIPFTIKVGENYKSFNADYLLDIATILGITNDEIPISSLDDTKTPLFIIMSNTKAMLLPINSKDFEHNYNNTQLVLNDKVEELSSNMV